eukprot:6247866-Amphidinium_carterae.4
MAAFAGAVGGGPVPATGLASALGLVSKVTLGRSAWVVFAEVEVSVVCVWGATCGAGGSKSMGSGGATLDLSLIHI